MNAEEKPEGQAGANTAKEEKGKADPKDSTDELCELSLEDDLLLLREDEEEDFGKPSVKCCSLVRVGRTWCRASQLPSVVTGDVTWQSLSQDSWPLVGLFPSKSGL